MKKQIFLTMAILCSNLFAGSLFPSAAVVVNEKGNEKEIDPSKFGYVGLAYNPVNNDLVRMDLKEITSGNKIRISLNPELENSISFSIGPIQIGEKKFAKDTISKYVIVEQLPPGNYVTTYFYLSEKSSGISLKPDTLHVEVGKILSLGKINSQIKFASIVPILKVFRVWTESPIADSAYIPFGTFGITTSNIAHKTLELAKD